MRIDSTDKQPRNSGAWVPPQDIQPKELLVVACTEHFFGASYGQNIQMDKAWGLNLNGSFSYDRSRMLEADALWFHGPSIRSLPKKQPGQKWILMCMESEVNYPFLRDQRVMALFDIHMTYRLDADVPTLYPNWPQYGDFMDQPRSFAEKRRQSPVLYAASNPVPYRDRYVTELMQHIPVDSVGACLHNHDAQGLLGREEWAGGKGFESLVSLIRRYKFYLALENTQSMDYVTERVFMALIAGAVPIYTGAENIHDFLPSRASIIRTADFGSAEELAKYLRHLDRHESEYRSLLNWKTEAYPDQFRKLVDISSVDPLARMFIKLAHGCGHECRCGGRMR